MVDSQLASFTVSKSADVTIAARKARMLAALADVEKPRRTRLSKAVTEVCRSVLSSRDGVQNIGRTARVDFGLSLASEPAAIEVNIEWLEQASVAGDKNSGETTSSETNLREEKATSGDADVSDDSTNSVTDSGQSVAPDMAIRRLGELLDGFELKDWPGPGARAVLRIDAPPGFEFSEADAADWTALLEESQVEEALRRAEQRRRRLNSELTASRLHDEWTSKANEQDDSGLVSMLSLVASQTDNGVAILDGDTCFAWVNNAFASQWGYKLDSCSGQPLLELLRHEQTDHATFERLSSIIASGRSEYAELLVRQSDGEGRWTGMSLSPSLDESGAVQRWIVLLRDVTQQRSAADILSAARDAAEQANRAKSEFLANMSHEIRTPMNAVIGMTELALGTELTPEQHEYLSTVRMSAEALLELLNDILDLSKIEAGKIELDEVDFDLAEVVRDSLKALAVKSHSKGLELATRMPMDLPNHLHGDPLRLRQVLINLVGNAIKFTDRGEVVVEFSVGERAGSIGRIEPDAGPAVNDVPVSRDVVDGDAEALRSTNRHAEMLHFTVRDTGIGIPPERLSHVFEAFTQADASTTRQFGGTGLGLTITAELLRLMGGTVELESEVGVGSSFHVAVPFRMAEHEPTFFAARIDVSREHLEGRTVLVVDDNATNRRILQELLANWGLRPRIVSAAGEALKELEAAVYYGRPFDLLLVDAQMPGTDGFDLIETVRNREDLMSAPVMMLSSADRADSARRCRELGIATYLVKPVSQSSLLESILGALSAPPDESFATAASSEHVTPQPGAASQPFSTNMPAAIAERALVPLRLLVADDHEANRRLAEKILQKRGHECAHARTGQEVLQQLAQNSFDLILMDVQMPQLDGLQTTVRIRESEVAAGNHIPIVALTAHAMKGDREKCLSAGMDGYLSKPLRARELVALVEKLCEPVIAARVGTAAAITQQAAASIPSSTASEFAQPEQFTSPEPESEFDFSGALDRMDGDVELLVEQMRFFLNDAPNLLDQIEQAASSSNGPLLQSAAHRLKGLVASYDHTPAAELCRKLEFAGHDGVLKNLAPSTAELRQHVATLSRSVQKYADEKSVD